MPTSTARAEWRGKLKDGQGHFEAASGAFKGDYSFPTRFGDAKGTNPEELLAASHASCFSMALAFGLEQAGTPATSVRTTAKATVEPQPAGGFRVTRIALDTRGKVSGIDQAAFEKAAQAAKAGCPISQALANNLTIELTATLE